jgi:hypothetical protein
VNRLRIFPSVGFQPALGLLAQIVAERSIAVGGKGYVDGQLKQGFSCLDSKIG